MANTEVKLVHEITRQELTVMFAKTHKKFSIYFEVCLTEWFEVFYILLLQISKDGSRISRKMALSIDQFVDEQNR